MDKVTEKYQKLFEGNGLFEVKDVSEVNYRPHPYCIGSKHLEHNNSMYLGDKEIREMEKTHGPMCSMYVNDKGAYRNSYKRGYKKCELLYDEHTSDKVMFLQLVRNGTPKELQDVLEKVDIESEFGKDKIDGLTFIETKEKYRLE